MNGVFDWYITRLKMVGARLANTFKDKSIRLFVQVISVYPEDVNTPANHIRVIT